LAIFEVDGVGAEGPGECRRVAHRLHQLHPVPSFAQLEPGDRAQLLHHEPRVFALRVQARTHRRAADPQVAQRVRRLGDAGAVALDRMAVRRELLSQSDRCRILQVRAARLDDPVERLALGEERGR